MTTQQTKKLITFLNVTRNHYKMSMESHKRQGDIRQESYNKGAYEALTLTINELKGLIQ